MVDETPEGGFHALSDLEEAASKKIVDAVWSFLQGGAGEELVVRANRDAFRRRTLRPRVLQDVSSLELSTEILGRRSTAPFYASAVAYQGLIHPEAEEGTARACAEAGVPLMLSTLSSCSLEEVAAAAPKGDRWFQLYLQPEFSGTRELIERAEKAGFRALVLTVDAPCLANRDRQATGGIALATAPPLGNGGHIQTPSRRPEAAGPSRYTLRQETSATWEIVDRLTEATQLPLVVKGILTAEDARQAVDHGASAVIVSNHGGRQLDSAPAALDALPEVVEATGGKADVYLDSGVRRGSDIVIALALGAKAVGLGRPIMWGLGAGGQAGVAKVIALLKQEMAMTLALTGRRSIPEIDRSLLGPLRA